MTALDSCDHYALRRIRASTGAARAIRRTAFTFTDRTERTN